MSYPDEIIDQHPPILNCDCHRCAIEERNRLRMQINQFIGAPTLSKEPMNTLLHNGITELVNTCHGASRKSGWWNDLNTGEPLPLTQERVGDKLMLIVSEIAEAKEGHRKNLKDDHLPTRPMIEVELADAVIRIADLAGALKLDLAGAITEKLAYNANRADHKIENRKAENGKKT